MMLKLGFLPFLLALDVSASVIKRVDFGRYYLVLFDSYQVPNEHVNRLDRAIGVTNNLNWAGMNYLKPAARAPNTTYDAVSGANVAASVDGSNAYITANYDGSPTSLFDLSSFRWGCVVGDRTGQDDDPIDVSGMYTGCNLTLTGYRGQDQVAQQTFRYVPTRMTCQGCTTYSMMVVIASTTTKLRKIETVTFTVTYPEAVNDTQLAGLYLDDVTTINYARV